MSTRDLHQPQEPSVGRNWWRRWIRGENESSLALSLRSLSEISPFHLVLNPNGVIRHCGPSLQKLMGRNPSQLSLQSCLERGDDMGGRSPVSMQQLNELQHQCLQLHLIDNKELELTGQILSLEDGGQNRWLLDLRPKLETLGELWESGLTLQDLSLIDPFRTNMLSLLMARSLQQELLGALHEQEQNNDA